MAATQTLEDLLRQGVELSRAKKFQEAGPLFRQALILEPRHSGAAYLLALALYFSGSFDEALILFRQFAAPGSPLEPAQIQKLRALANYARWEQLRLDYWRSLRLKHPGKLDKEMRRRKLEPASLEAFHLQLANGLAAQGWQEYRAKADPVRARVTLRPGRSAWQSGISDADQTIGAHLEAVRGEVFLYLPFTRLRAVEFGTVKRWMTAQVEYRDGSRESLMTPLTYRGTMGERAFGVQEGIETITRPVEGLPEISQAFGQKQVQASGTKTGLAEILRIEFDDSVS